MTDDVVRLQQCGDVAALVPHLVGFVPEESLVVLSLRGPRSQVGLTARVDLAAPPDELVARLAPALRTDGAAACLLVVLTDAPGHRPFADLVALATERLGVPVRDALLVRDGRWSSYTCAAACCPPEGTPVPSRGPVAQRLAAERVGSGRALLASREELVASVQPVLPLGPGPVAAAQEAAWADLAARLARSVPQAHAAERARWERALAAWEQRPHGDLREDVAALVVGLQLVPVRDDVVAWGLDRGAALLGLLLAVCRAATAPHDAHACAALSWVAYAEGEGSLALEAALRALRSDPDCSMAQLLLTAVDVAAPPALLRQAMRGVAPRASRRHRRRGAA